MNCKTLTSPDTITRIALLLYYLNSPLPRIQHVLTRLLPIYSRLWVFRSPRARTTAGEWLEAAASALFMLSIIPTAIHLHLHRRAIPPSMLAVLPTVPFFLTDHTHLRLAHRFCTFPCGAGRSGQASSTATS